MILSRVVLAIVTVVISSALAFAIGSDDCTNSKVTYTINVSQFNTPGNFRKVQDAINAIPSNNRRWIRVLVGLGTYIEQVQIPTDKQCVILQGNSPKNTIISFDAHESTDTSATFISFANNFMAMNIAFENTYDSDKGIAQWKQALAIGVYGDKSAFYRCRFVGIQDTLWDAKGRHYFKSCLIHGTVDFIWGNGQSVYEDCWINVIRGGGFITAQGRQGSNDPSGFVFIRGKVYGIGKESYLGRAYGLYARVIFQQTYLDTVVSAIGWEAWHAQHHEENVMYVENKCFGAGSNLSHGVQWMKRPSATELSKYTISNFINQDGWISKQPNAPTS